MLRQRIVLLLQTFNCCPRKGYFTSKTVFLRSQMYSIAYSRIVGASENLSFHAKKSVIVHIIWCMHFAYHTNILN